MRKRLHEETPFCVRLLGKDREGTDGALIGCSLRESCSVTRIVVFFLRGRVDDGYCEIS